MPIDDLPQTFEDRVQAEFFMLKHGMHPEPGTEAYDSGAYACTSCQSAKARCLVPLLAHMGHKRFCARSCLRCSERMCSLAGTVMSETATGGISLEKPDTNWGVGTPMVELGTAHAHVTKGRSTSTTTPSPQTAHGHGDGHKPVPRLKRMQLKPPRSRGTTPAPPKSPRAKSPNTSRAGSPHTHLPTPGHSSPSHTGSSEGAVSALVSSSPLVATTPLPSSGRHMLATALEPALSVGDGLVSKLQTKHERHSKNGSLTDLHSSNASLTDLGPPPAPPTSLSSFASSIQITKRRRLTSLALGPGLSATISGLPSSEQYRAALSSARAEMHATETLHESAVATLATAQHTSALAIAAAARIEAEAAHIEQERQAALAQVAACAKALEGIRSEVTVKKREREEAAVAVTSAGENVAAVATQLEEHVEAYHRVVRGFIVEQS